MTDALTIAVTPEVVDAIAQRAAEIVLEQLATLSREDGSRWLYGAKEAAAYLSWPVGRVEKLSAAGVLPSHRLEGEQRRPYRTDELDAWLADHYEGPARLRAV